MAVWRDQALPLGAGTCQRAVVACAELPRGASPRAALRALVAVLVERGH